MLPVTADKVPLIPRFQIADNKLSDGERTKAIDEFKKKHKGERPVHVGATRSAFALRKIWAAHPNALPALSCGPTGVVVVDADSKVDGPRKIADLTRANGGTSKDVPVTKTQNRGLHLIYKNTAGLTSGFPEFRKAYGCDVKGAGSQVLLPGAVTADGKRYESAGGYKPLFEALRTDTIPNLPDFMLDAITAGKGIRKSDPLDIDGDDSDPLYLPPDPLDHEAADPLALDDDETPTVPKWLTKALASVDNSDNVDIDYETWVKIGAAVHYETRGSDAGRAIFEDWSAQSPKHDDAKFEKTWQSFGRTNSKTVTGATIRNLAEQAGWAKDASDKFGVVADGDEDPGTPPPEYDAIQARKVRMKRARQLLAESTGYQLTDPDTIPPRARLYGDAYSRGTVSLLAAFGGRGKSLLYLTEALAMVTGRPLHGIEPVQPLRVMLWNGEDPMSEIHRRIGTAAKHYGMSQGDIGDRLHVMSGFDVPLNLVGQDKSGKVVLNAPMLSTLRESLIKNRIDVLLLDPLVKLHTVNENDNNAMDTVVGEFAAMAMELNIAVGIATHVRKPSAKDDVITEHDVRGAGSAVAAARAVRVINPLKDSDARKFGIAKLDAWKYIVISQGKTNFAMRSKDTTVLQLVSVKANNSNGPYQADNTPVLVLHRPEKINLIGQDEVDRMLPRLRDETWTVDARGGGAKTWFGNLIAEICDVDPKDERMRSAITDAITDLERRGVVIREADTSKTRNKRVVFRPGKAEPQYVAADDDEDPTETGDDE